MNENEKYPDFVLDCSPRKASMPEAMTTYCCNAILGRRPRNPGFVLYDTEAWTRMTDKLGDLKEPQRLKVLRFLYGSTDMIQCAKDLPKLLPMLAVRMLGTDCTVFRFSYRDGVYEIEPAE